MVKTSRCCQIDFETGKFQRVPTVPTGRGVNFSVTFSRICAMDINDQDNGSSAASSTPKEEMKVVGDGEMKEVAARVKKHQSNAITMDAKPDFLLFQ